MTTFNEFMSNNPISSLWGTLSGNGIKGNQNAAGSNVDEAKAAYSGLTPPTFSPVNYQGPASAPGATATAAGPSTMNGVSTNPAYNQQQQAQMTALARLSANGGRNAASESNLAAIQAGENANAKGQRDAIMQNAEARGQGGSGASLLAQLQGSQAATDRQSAEDLGVAGQEANTALGAGQSAAGIGAGMENQAFGESAAKAAANDAVNRFNAGENTGVSEFNSQQQQGVNNATAAAKNAGQTMNNFQMPQQTYQDTYQKASGTAGADMGAANYYGGQADAGTAAQGNMMGSLIGGGAALGAAGIKKTGAGGGNSRGGRVPGAPIVPGDSSLNDFVPLKPGAPGETIVPASLSQHGTSKQIGNFVKNAPPAKVAANPGQNKEAMLSALRNIARRRAA